MSLLTPILASNALIDASNLPKTAVFVGGTDGIGRATLKAVVSRGSSIKVYIVSRNKPAHQHLLRELAALNPKATLVCVEGQTSLVAEAQRIAAHIAAQEKSIDLLFLSSGYLPFAGRQETSEGLAASLAVAYYSHMVFVLSLLPQLRVAAAVSSARVINILAAGRETSDLLLDDLDLKGAANFSVRRYAGHASTAVTLSLKRVAEEPANKDIVFIHAHPGVVNTDLFKKSMGTQLGTSNSAPQLPAGESVSYTLEEAGERCLYMITSAEYGGKGIALQSGRQAAETLAHGKKGSLFTINDKHDFLQPDQLLADLDKMGASQAIWDYTVELLKTHADGL